MSYRFPEYPGLEFLTFGEVCDVLPEDALKHVMRYGVVKLEPYGCWASSSTPEAPRPVPRGWLKPSPEIDPGLLYYASKLRVHGGPNETLHLYFDKKRVEAFRAAGGWAPHPSQELPWFMGKEPDKGGRGTEDYKDAIREATAVKGGKLTHDEGLQAIRAKGATAELDGHDFYVGGFKRSRRTFTNALSEAARALHGNPKDQ